MNTEKSFIRTEITTVENEISGDYILPDSFSDVKNILNARGRLKEVKKYFGANDAEISGCVIYDIMFTAINAEGKEDICSVSFNDDVKFNCRYKIAQNVGVGAQVRLRDVSCRMANPRKFSVKALLETIMFEEISSNAYPNISQSTAHECGMQYKWGEIDVFRCKSASLCEHSFSDNIELDLKSPEIDRIIHSDVTIHVRDARSNDINQAVIKLCGALCINLIYLDTEGNNRAVSKEVSFGISVNEDECAMIGEIDPGTLIIPAVYISELNVNVGKNGYGEAKVIEFDADYDIDLMLLSSAKEECVVDAYSTEFDTECKFELCSYLKPVYRLRNNFTYSDTRERGEYGIDNDTIFNVSIPTLSEITAGKNAQSVTLGGKLNNKVTLADEEQRFKSKQISKSFSYKSNIDINTEDIALIGSASVDNSRVRADNERVYSDAEIYLDYLLATKESVRICKNINVSEKPCNKNTRELFCIYYPCENETLWDIAKDKKCTVEGIRRLNPGVDTCCREALIIE